MPTLADLKSYIPFIDAKTAEIIDEFAATLPDDSSDQNFWALETIKEYCRRPGKHIRGSLAGLAYDHLTKQHHSEAAILLAVAVEFMHNYLLIVDDVMDQSNLRRGEATVHCKYREKYQDAGQFEADMMGINIGLLVQHLAGLTISKLPEACKTDLEAVMHRNIALTGLGQIDDMYQTIARKVEPAAIIGKYRKKSSYYTFVNPLECAYALAGNFDQSVADDCEAYGIPAGVAFQLRDDYVGVFGDTTLSGKANLDDIHEGKYTLLVAEALHGTSGKDHEALMRILGNSKATEKDLMHVRDIMNRSGAVEKAETYTKLLVNEATAAAEASSSWDSSFGEFLVELVQYSVKRDT